MFLPAKHELLGTAKYKNLKFHKINFNYLSFWRRHIWEQIIFPLELKRNKIDILFTAKNANILFAPCRTVISIRNMEPFLFNKSENDICLNASLYFRRLITLVSMIQADRIIVVSRGSQSFLLDNYYSFYKKSFLIYNGNPVDRNKICRIRQKRLDSFLLTASKFVSYANQKNLVLGYELLRAKHADAPSLWFAGGPHDVKYFKSVLRLVKEKNLQQHIRFLGLLPHNEVLRLYSQAEAFVFPSTLEACPHTLIEAMTFGLPIAAANYAPMPEICGSAAIYFDPKQPDEIAEALKHILFNRDLRASLKNAARRRSREYDWDKTAKELVKVFLDLRKKKNM